MDNNKFDSEVKASLPAAVLREVYEALDKEERPYAATIRKTKPGYRDITIRCEQGDQEHFSKIVEYENRD